MEAAGWTAYSIKCGFTKSFNTSNKISSKLGSDHGARVQHDKTTTFNRFLYKQDCDNLVSTQLDDPEILGGSTMRDHHIKINLVGLNKMYHNLDSMTSELVFQSRLN